MRGHKSKATASTMGENSADMCPCDLGTAIVHRACADYLMILRGRTHHGHSVVGTTAEIEQFFRSRWFGFLCDADGDAILDALRRMSKQGKKTIHYGVYSQIEKEDWHHAKQKQRVIPD